MATEKILKIKEFVGNVMFDEPMSNHTTFKIGGPADAYAEITSEDELTAALNYLEAECIPYEVIGNGSNLLVSDEGFRGVILSLRPLRTDSASGVSDDEALIKKYAGNLLPDGSLRVTVFAGNLLSVFSRDMAKLGYTGTEPLAGIPGSIGGAVAMNAGAYGGEIKDIIESAVVIEKDSEGRFVPKELKTEELDLGYRTSAVLKNRLTVVSATFVLKKGIAEESLLKIADFNGRRRDKQPIELPSAGSTFKRPKGYFAGKLIEDSGLRGYSVGNAGVSTKHCGFVVNNGGATAAEVKQVIDDVRGIVFSKFGVILETEVRFIGRFQEAPCLSPTM